MIDATHLQLSNKQYNGNTKKLGVVYNNIDYIVKFAKDNDMSVYCEYIASELLTFLGILCHKVELGLYNGEVVDIIKDFTSGTKLTLHSYKDTKQSSEDTDISTKEYTYDDVLYLIEHHLKLTDEYKIEAQQRFWDMFIGDAIIGNRDRHWGNWGYLSNGKIYKFAPLYDNGAGLFPGINKVIAQYININTRKQFMYERVYTFPASLFKIKRPDRSYRSNYAEMFKDLRINKIFARQVNAIKTRVSYQSLFAKMFDICRNTGLSWEYCRFFIEIATLRYACIVLRLDFNKTYSQLESELSKYD